MYKEIRNVIVAFVIWIGLSCLATSIAMSIIKWENMLIMTSWGLTERLVCVTVFILIGILAWKLEK